MNSLPASPNDSMINYGSKIKKVAVLFQHSIHQLAGEKLDKLLIEVTELLQSVLQQNNQLLSNNSDQELCAYLLAELAENLQLALILLNSIHQFMQLMKTKGTVNLLEFYTVPINLTNLLYSVFLHCKHSNDTYIVYFNHMDDLKNLFKIAQVIHQELCSFIENQLMLATSEHDEKATKIINQIMDIICDTGSILFQVNIKSMLLSWRCYANLLKKFGTLSDAIKPIKILFEEVIVNVNKFIETRHCDIQILKVCNYLLKVSKAIIANRFESNENVDFKTESLILLTRLYKFSKPQAEYGLDVKQAQSIEAHIFCDLSDVICQVLIDLGTLNMRQVQDESDFKGFINISKLHLLQAKLFTVSQSTYNYLSILLNYLHANLQEETNELFNNESTYRAILVDLCVSILSVAEKEYYDIEEILLRSILEGLGRQTVFAFDLFILLMKNVQPTLRYDTLVAIIERLKANSLSNIRADSRPILFSLLHNCYALLPDTLQVKLLNKYLPDESLKAWTLCGIHRLPLGRDYLTDVIANNLSKLLDNVNAMDRNDFQYMMDSIAVLSKQEPSAQFAGQKQSLMMYKDLPTELQSKMSELVTKLWLSDEACIGCDLYMHFVSNALLPMIIQLIATGHMEDIHLYKVLNSLKLHVGGNDAIKVISLKVLVAIFQKPTDEFSPMLHTAVAQLFHSFSVSNNEPDVLNLYVNQAKSALHAATQWTHTLQTYSGGGDDEQNAEPVMKKMKLQTRPAPLSTRNTDTAITASGNHKEDPVDDQIQDILDHLKELVDKLWKLSSRNDKQVISREQSQRMCGMVNLMDQFLKKHSKL